MSFEVGNRRGRRNHERGDGIQTVKDRKSRSNKPDEAPKRKMGYQAIHASNRVASWPGRDQVEDKINDGI